MTCINPNHIKNLENDLKAKGFSLHNLRKFAPESEQRVKYMEQFFNNRSEAEFFNRKYENYVLNRQKSNMREWIRKGKKKGISAGVQKDLLEKIDSLTKVLKPSDKPILNGLVKQKLGFTVTPDYAKGIYEKYNTYKNNLATVMKNRPNYMKLDGTEANDILTEQIEQGGGDVYELAKSLAELKAEYEEARLGAEKAETYANVKTKTQLLAKQLGEGIKKFAGFLKSMKATFDVSAPRQLSAGAVYSKEFFDLAKREYWNSLKLLKKIATKELSVEEARAITDMYVLSRPNALNGMYRKLGVDVGLKEEAFPESFVGKKAGKYYITNLLPGSEVVYSYAIELTRADYADEFIKQYNNDLGGMQKDGVGDFINQLTGRGRLHFALTDESAATLNALMFAPRWLAARIRTITDLQYLVRGSTQIERARGKAALNNALLFIALPSLIKALRRAFDPDDPHGEDALERFFSAFDPRSSEFGKWRWGETRIDMTFGMGGIITAAARGISQKTVTSGGVKKDATWQDVLGGFFEGKLSPAARTAKDIQSALWGSGEGFGGRKLTWDNMLLEAFAPISLQNLTTVDSWSAGVGMGLDVFGVSANTYEPKDRDIGKSAEFKREEEKLGWTADRAMSDINPAKNSSIMTKLSGTKQERAIKDFKELYNREITKLVKSNAYKRMKNADKVAAFKKVREDANKAIKKKYGLK